MLEVGEFVKPTLLEITMAKAETRFNNANIDPSQVNIFWMDYFYVINVACWWCI